MAPTRPTGGVAPPAALVQLILDADQRLVKPNFKIQRNTIILRDIAADIPETVCFARRQSDASAPTVLVNHAQPRGDRRPRTGGTAAPQEVRAIFDGGDCAAIKNIRADIGDTWFVSFESEADAINTLFVIRERTFRDQKVRAGIKSENLLRPTYVAPRVHPVRTHGPAPQRPTPAVHIADLWPLR